MSEAAIVDFLVQRFSEEELRRLVRYHYHDLASALPGSPSSLTAVADGWVQLLVRTGRIDGDFFALLRRERERFVADIDALERLSASTRAVGAATPTTGPTAVTAGPQPTTTPTRGPAGTPGTSSTAKPRARRQGKPAYRWLHLSDIHFGCRGQAQWVQVVDDFERSLDAWLGKIGEPVDLVLVSGDLTNRSTAVEYERLSRFFERLLARIEARTGHRPLLVAVPGNHDVERPKDLLDFAAYDRYTTVGDAQAARLHERLWTAKNPDRLVPLFAEYTRWQQTFMLPPLQVRSDVAVHTSFFPGDLTVVIDTPGRFPLAIVGLNSAWLHYQDVDAGALAMPIEQFHAALPDPAAGGSPLDLFGDRGARQALLMHHHPREWLSHKHQEIHDGSIYVPRRFAACLFGHMHEPTATNIAVAGGDARCYFQASSLFGLEHDGEKNESRIFGYAFGMIREDGEVLLWPLRSLLMANNETRFTKDPRFHWKDDKFALLRRGAPGR